jgi:hypothetical protein
MTMSTRLAAPAALLVATSSTCLVSGCTIASTRLPPLQRMALPGTSISPA